MGVSIRNSIFERTIVVPVGGYLAGRIENLNTKSWVLQGLQNRLEGEQATFRSDCQVEIDKNVTANVFAVGATVGFLQATQKATLAAAGDFDIVGKVLKASGATDTTVLVSLN